jgi:hypothetical protein
MNRKGLLTLFVYFFSGFLFLAAQSSEAEASATKGFESSGRPRIFAVCVGVAKYKLGGSPNQVSNLNFTDDDAYRMYAFLKSCKGGCVDDDNIAVLVDEAATKKNILETMDKIFSKAGPDDMLWFYFSGHGGQEGFLCPYDMDGNDLNTFLMYDEVKAAFKKHPARYKVVFLDACHSGTIFSQRPPQNSSVNQSSANTSVLLMVSSLPSEFSQEEPRLRQGVFTYYMLKGLKGAADRDNNAVVTLEELFPYVKANVLNFTQNKQTPFIEGNASRQMPLSSLK